MNLSNTERARQSTVNCRSPIGNVLIFSFHAISADVMRCYLFRGGQSIRFLPRDIKHVLPRMFVQRPDNKRFLDDEDRIAELAARLKFEDTHFRAWYSHH